MDRLVPFQVTVPANTAIASAITTDLPFFDGIVDVLHVTIPPGPSGLVGFQFRHKGAPIFPFGAADFVIGDGREIDWPLRNAPAVSGWQIRAYNLDQYDHTLYIEFQITELGGAPAQRYPDLQPIGA